MNLSAAQRLAVFVGLVAAIVTTSRVSRAGDASGRLTWKPAWSTMRPAEYVVTGVAGGASLLAFFALKSPEEPRWTGGILFDDSARDALRLRSQAARDR